MNATIVTFPNTEHGINRFVTEAPGKRRMIGVADGYFRPLADWDKGPADGALALGWSRAGW